MTAQVVAGLKRRLRSLLPRKPRRFHAYCVGAGKTGTHSVYAIFATHFRSAHEPDREELVELLDREEHGSLSPSDKVRALLRRDRRLNLEMDASAFNRRFVALYAELFPDAKFFLTVRDPYTRTDSLINHMLNYPPTTELAVRRRERIFRTDQFSHGPEEDSLLEWGLPPLDGLLADYAETNASIESALPRERLLVVRTDRLAESAPRMANFLGIAASQLDLDRSHEYKAKRKYGILAGLDPDFVDERVKAHCARLLTESFPEIGGIRDVASRLGAS